MWPSNPTSGHTHWGNQIWKRHVHPNVHRSTFFFFKSQGVDSGSPWGTIIHSGHELIFVDWINEWCPMWIRLTPQSMERNSSIVRRAVSQSLNKNWPNAYFVSGTGQGTAGWTRAGSSSQGACVSMFLQAVGLVLWGSIFSDSLVTCGEHMFNGWPGIQI